MKKLFFIISILFITTILSPQTQKKEYIKPPMKHELVKRFPDFDFVNKSYYTVYKNKLYKFMPTDREINVYESEATFDYTKQKFTPKADKIEEIEFIHIGKYSYSYKKWKKQTYLVKGLGMIGKTAQYKLPKKVLREFQKKYKNLFKEKKVALFPKFEKIDKNTYLTFDKEFVYKFSRIGKQKKLYIYKKRYTKDTVPEIIALKKEYFILMGMAKNKQWYPETYIRKIKQTIPKTLKKQIIPAKISIILPDKIIKKFEELY